MRATGTPDWMIWMQVSTASSTPGKAQTAAEIASGMPARRSVTSTITPSVPSDPTKSRVRSYPADDLRALVPVRIVRPSASTTVSPSTLSRIVP